MTRKSRGTYVLAFGLVVVVGGIALAFLPGPGWLLIAIGSAIAGIGVALLLLEQMKAKADTVAPTEPPTGRAPGHGR